MFKSVFSKYFSVLSLIIVSGFFLMTAFQVLLFTRAVTAEKETLLTVNAQNIADRIETGAVTSQLGKGGVSYVFHVGGLLPFLNMIGDSVDATVLITDGKERVLLVTDEQSGLSEGDRVPGVMEYARQGTYFSAGTMNGLWTTPRYTAVASVNINGSLLGTVVVSAPTTTVWTTLRSNMQVYLMSALGALFLCFVVIYWLTLQFVRPLREMAAATRSFAKGDFSARVHVKGKDEVAELGEALNHMAVSLSSVEVMRRSFIANVSHELKTPMTTISGFLDGMLDGTIPPEQQPHYMKIVSDEVKRLSRLVHSMLDLSRIDSGELKMTKVRMNLTEAACSVLVSFEQRIEKKRLQITGIDECDKMEIDGDFDLMSQVLYNLLDNAVKFTNDGGDIDIRLFRQSGKIHCVIRNTGDGIPAQEMPQIFERFYKSDRSRSLDKNGMGLGLYIVKTVISLHGGEITVRSVEKEFTEFAFWVPAPEELPPTGTVQ